MGRPHALFAIPLQAGERDASDPPTVSVAIGIAEATISPADQQPKDKPSRASAWVGPPQARFDSAPLPTGGPLLRRCLALQYPSHRPVPSVPCRLLNLESARFAVSHARPLPEVPPQTLTAHQKRRPPVPSWRDEAPAADGAKGAARTWAAPWRPPRDTAAAGASVSPKRRLVLDQALSALFAKRLGREVGAAAGGRRPAGGGARRASAAAAERAATECSPAAQSVLGIRQPVVWTPGHGARCCLRATPGARPVRVPPSTCPLLALIRL